MTLTERNRLAQELHDGIAQDLVGISYSLDLILSNETTSLETRLAVRKVRLEVSDLLDRVRTEIHDLYQINQTNLVTQLRAAAEDICGGLALEFNIADILTDANQEVAHQVMRIVIEILRNVIKHAEATHVSIGLTQDTNEVIIAIRDDGKAVPLHDSRSFGLTAAKNRAHSIGGSLNWQLEAYGSTAILRFPLSQKPL